MRIKTIELFFDKPKEDFYIKNITDDVSKAIKESKMKEGIVNIFVSGSTASVSTMEFEPNLVKDIEKAMEKIAPSDIEYEHHKTWGDENGKSHVRATILGPSLTVPFKDGKLLLGTWQQIVLLDFDVPKRERKVVVQIIGE
jgi:secondary thiamine-phosphate synthase enzyme